MAEIGGEVATQTLLELLDSQEDLVRLAGIQGLGLIGSPECLTALSALFDGDLSKGLGSAAVQAIARVGTSEALEVLLGLLQPGQSLNSPPTNAILEAIGSMSDAQALPTLMDAWKVSLHVEVRRVLIEAIVRTGDPLAFDTLLHAAKHDPDSIVCCEAMNGLGILGDPRALPVLRWWEQHGNEEQRSYASTAIARIENG